MVKYTGWFYFLFIYIYSIYFKVIFNFLIMVDI